ncbi:PD-(D/E)XK nuclease-like domain-containing protein [Myroides odoratus]|uniref:PD-(D/E)XK nuclease-like domain-containing protein n=1 Tax=Myroides odoratus TaxID=256 RepID=UPI003342455D
MGASNILFQEYREQEAIENDFQEENINIQYSEEQQKRQELIDKLRNREVKLSYSWLKEFQKSPLHFLNYKLKQREPQTESMIFGSICDLLITEPDRFNDKFKTVSSLPSTDNQKGFVSDILNGLSKEDAFKNNYSRGSLDNTYESLKDYIECLQEKKTPVTAEIYNSAKKLTDSLLQNESINVLINSCSDFQEKIEWKYKGWDFIGFKDCSSPGLIVDLKHSKDANPEAFERDVYRMDYFLQMGLYSSSEIETPDCFFLVYEKSGHFSILKIDYSFLAYGLRKVDFLLAKLEDCIQNDRWNESYNFFDDRSYKTIYKPKWAKGFELDIEDE